MLVTKLKEYRERDGLKQADLADLVGVRRETIVNLEKGRYNPSLKLAMDLAKVFHVSVEELFRYTEESRQEHTKNRDGLRTVPAFFSDSRSSGRCGCGRRRRR